MIRSNFRALQLVSATLAFVLASQIGSTQRAFGVPYTWNVVGPANWDVAGNWTGGPPAGPPTTGDTGTIGSGIALANATLTGSPDITVNNTGTLRISAFGSALTSGGTVTATTGGLIDWSGTSASTSTITLGNGARIGRSPSDTHAISNNALALLAGANVTASTLPGTVIRSTLALELRGPLSSADNAATLTVQPAVAGALGALVLAPTVANTGFIGNVHVEGGPSSTRGGLVVSGTGALSNVNNVTFGTNGIFRFRNATDPLAAGKAITVTSGGIVEWESNGATYSGAVPTLTFANGSFMGRQDTPDALGISRENIVIGNAPNATVTAGRINSSVTWTPNGLELRGALSAFDNTATLAINPTTAGFLGSVTLNPTVANNPFHGNIHIQEGPGATRGTLVLTGTGALANVNNITIDSNAILRFSNAVNPFAAGKAITVGNGARIEWEGTAGSYSVTPPTITFLNGSTFGREGAADTHGISRENIVIDAGATVTASRINSSVMRSGASVGQALGVELRGVLSSGDASSTLVINPTTANFRGGLIIAPTTANPFSGNVIIQPGPGALTPGSLVLSGTGALANVGSITVNAGSILRFHNAVDPLPSGFNINIPNGGRMEWDGTAGSYSVTPPTITFQNGAEFGRHEHQDQLGVSRDNLVIAPGATVTARRISASVARNDLGLRLDGSLDGAADSKLIVAASLSGGTQVPYSLPQLGPLMINPTTANPFLGTVEVTGLSAANQGQLILQGTGPLANAALLDIKNFGTVTVLTAGAADGIDEINTESGGTLRFRSSAGANLANTSLTGNGRIRSEAIEGGNQNINVDQALRSLSVSGVEIAPGDSIGTLTIQTTNLLVTGGSQVTAELSGAAQDMLVVEGGLTLDGSSVLELVGLDDAFTNGFYPIISYTGGLTGTFGSVIDNLTNGRVAFVGVDYGTVFANMISVQIYIVPEPSTFAILGLGAVGLAGGRLGSSRRRRRQVA